MSYQYHIAYGKNMASGGKSVPAYEEEFPDMDSVGTEPVNKFEPLTKNGKRNQKRFNQ